MSEVVNHNVKYHNDRGKRKNSVLILYLWCNTILGMRHYCRSADALMEKRFIYIYIYIDIYIYIYALLAKAVTLKKKQSST